MDHSATKLFNETCSLLDSKKYPEALSTCNQALSLEPENEELLFLRAQIFAFWGKKNKAIDESEKLLSKNPEMICAFQTIVALDDEIKNLAEKLESEDESIRKKAIKDLSKINRPSAALLLSNCIINDEELYSDAAAALHRMGPFTIPFLYNAYNRTVQAPSAVAYTTISYFGDAALPYLQDLLQKGEDEDHINELIAHIKGEEREETSL